MENSLLARYHADLNNLQDKFQFRTLPQQQYLNTTTMECHHHNYLVMASNNYLGLTDHPQVRAAAAEAIALYGTSSTGSRLITGSNQLFDKLEMSIANFKNTPKALIFNTGYMANVGTISALMRPGDLILSDELNHASIIDGCRLSRAHVQIYRHRDMHNLEKLLRQAPTNNILIVTDSVFSMDGTLAPLDNIYNLACKYNALLMVDDAHATGILGKGHGSAAEFNLEGKIDIQMGTLSKALASEGGFVATNKLIHDYLINHARSFIFSTALTPADIAAAQKSLELIRDNPAIVEHLHHNIRYFSSRLQELHIPADATTPIFPITFNTNEASLKISKYLYEHQIIATAIRPPTVPEDTSRLRVTITAKHRLEQLDYFIDKLREALTLIY